MGSSLPSLQEEAGDRRPKVCLEPKLQHEPFGRNATRKMRALEAQA